VQFSKPDKVLWPPTKENSSLTKKDLIEYYNKISYCVLPYLKDRPLSLLRYPNGINNEPFFHRNREGQSKPSYVASVMVYAEARKRKTSQLICNKKRLYCGLPILAASRCILRIAQLWIIKGVMSLRTMMILAVD
jgi:bifunctional non-homologous end joining protein LigD